MSYNLRKAVEERRKKLINKLLVCNVYKDKEELMYLTLSELENEYKSIQSNGHPHDNMGSIQWINRNKTL
ncbi:Fur-regulated basic protein FbpA [Niallia oryzisoli]|uniref:Fur-regulated basic protein FbpA n=1 Tax=Niallia oryzisoli TaxID=1737571 RepID=A0ABZ2CA95_9BACI